MKELEGQDLQYLCDKYHLNNYQLESILSERWSIQAKMQPSLPYSLIVGAQTLITIKKAQGQNVIISECNKNPSITNQQILDPEDGGFILQIMGNSVAQYLFDQYDMIVKDWAFYKFTSEKDRLIMQKINSVNLEWNEIKESKDFNIEYYNTGWHYFKITLEMLSFMHKAFSHYSLVDNSKPQQLWGKINQIIGFYADCYAKQYTYIAKTSGVIPYAFAFDLLYLREIIPHTDWHTGKNSSSVEGTNQIFHSTNSRKTQYIRAKIKCYMDAKC